jgi:predicted transcriptional regulator
MMKKLEIGMRSLKEMSGDVLEAWKNAEAGRKVAPREALYFASMPQLLAVLTPARWSLLEALKRGGAMSVYALAKQLERNYSNVHSDVAKLLALGLIEKNEEGRVFVPWDEIHADFTLKAAA